MTGRVTSVRKVRLAIVVGGALALMSVSPGVAADLGVWPDTTGLIPSQELATERALASRLHAQYVREDISWALEEPRRGRSSEPYLKSVDRLIDADVALGLQPVVLLDQVPAWASADALPRAAPALVNPNPYYRPTSFASYARFVGRMIRRYRGRGVRAYEIWNEANLAQFWPSGPDAGSYAEMLRVAYGEAKRADARSVVISSGLSPVESGSGNVGAYAFLQGMLNAGAGSTTDAVGYHVYPSLAPGQCPANAQGRPAITTLCSVAEIRRMTESVVPRKPIWLTEFGYSTCSVRPPISGPPCLSEAQQGPYLTDVLTRLARDYPYVQVALLSELRDRQQRPDPLLWTDNLGLLRRDFSPKPAFAQVAAVGLAQATSEAGSPLVGLRRPTRIAETCVLLAGSVDGRGAPTRYQFEIRRRTRGASPLRVTLPAMVDDTRSRRPVRVGLGGLAPATRYQFRLGATNSAGSTRTPFKNFRTLRRSSDPPRRRSVGVARSRTADARDRCKEDRTAYQRR